MLPAALKKIWNPLSRQCLNFSRLYNIHKFQLTRQGWQEQQSSWWLLYWIWRLIVVVFLFAETPTYGCLEMYEVSWGCIFEVEGCFERINFYHVSVENRREVRHNGFVSTLWNVELVHFDTGLTSLLRERISNLTDARQTDDEKHFGRKKVRRRSLSRCCVKDVVQQINKE